MTELVVVGGGGHGRELLDVVAAVNAARHTWDLLGVVDDAPSHPERLERLGVPLLGPTSWLIEHPCAYALGIGTAAARRRIVERFDVAGLVPATIVHPSASLGSEVTLGEGVVIYQNAVVTTNVSIGRHTHLNVACAVQHDSVVGDFVQLSPGVLVNGDCTVGDDVFFGTGAVLTRGLRVGPGARIGAGAVALDDVAPGATVVGAPARPS